MTSTTSTSTLTFRAGGRTTRPPPRHRGIGDGEPPSKNVGAVLPAPSNLYSVVRTGVSQKRSPLHLENWIACVLTLDGRDKVTKVLQYASRLLCWHFAGLAAEGAGGAAAAAGGARPPPVHDVRLRRALCAALSQRFRALYTAIATSRKAFRLGRSLIELEKLKQIGWGEYLGHATRRPATGAVGPSPLSAAPPPTWKIVGGTVKLLGLIGFWAWDNLSFLLGSGFLDPIRVRPSVPDDRAADDPGALRTTRKKRATEWALRCYFFGILGGLYVNGRALWTHQNGALREARQRLEVAIQSLTKNVTSGATPDGKANTGEERVEAEAAGAHLRLTERKQVELFLAFLKSSCDFVVHSNSPGVDLHLRYRSKKNHEGVHCLAGLVSASTVLYNKFPNAD